MNRQIVKLFGFIVVLFAILVGFTSYWSVFDAKALKEKEANKRPLLEQQQIRRGRILAADGTVIAKSVAKGHGDGLRFVRRYPEGALFGHPIGYSFVRQGDSEFERFHNEELVGEESEFGSILDQLTGHNQEGDDIVTNLDLGAQRTALEDLEQAGFGAVRAASAKLDHAATTSGRNDSRGLAGDHRLKIDRREKECLNHLSFDDRRGDSQQRLHRERRGAFRHRPNVACESKLGEVVEKLTGNFLE